MSNTVLFVSQLPLGRCENLTAVWDMYDGDKEFALGQRHMRDAERLGYPVVVCDALPDLIEGKDKCKSVVICHGMTGNKVYGLDEQRDVDKEAFAQTDVATAASEASVPIVAKQLGIPEENVAAIGFPRTDAYFKMRKGDGGTFAAGKKAYLYAPTFRDHTKGGWLPLIDWELVDSMLDDDEVVVLKRHYFTRNPLLGSEFNHVVEVDPSEAITPYLVDCDVLVTDYSSTMTDAYLLGKPCVLVVDDMKEYLRDRGMYYQYPQTYSSRWLVAEGNEEKLVKYLREAASDGLGPVELGYRAVTAGACDGHSTERVCDLIRSLL